MRLGMNRTTASDGLHGAKAPHRLPFGVAEEVGRLPSAPLPDRAGLRLRHADFGHLGLFRRSRAAATSRPGPKILALDNQEATIFVGESIRYARSDAASNQNGGLTFSVEEDDNSPVNVGFQLLVIPHVIPGENKIMLLVIPQQRALNGTTSPIPGFDRFTVSGQTIDLPRVQSSTLVSHMLLRDKETAVIGGLLEDRDTNSRDKLPILGDLPILGALFQGQSRSKVRQNLIITITPRILRGSDAANLTIDDELAGRSERNAAEFEQLGTPGAPTPPAAPACAPATPTPAPVPMGR
jgi:general secretion pathway protein D